jgi:hypothetical protein
MYSVQTYCDCTYTMKRKIDLYSTFFFANKGLDAINMGNILHHKYVRAMFHLISKINLFLSFFYTYASLITPKAFNYRRSFKSRFCSGVCVAHHFSLLGFFSFFFYVLCLEPNVACISGMSLGYSVRYINAVSL